MQKYKLVSKKPVDMSKIPASEMDLQILRSIMISELDTINYYNQLACNTKNPEVIAVIRDIIEEEEDHYEDAEELEEKLEPSEDSTPDDDEAEADND